jgi:hypothetical protein
MNRAVADRDLRRVECLVAPAQGTPWALPGPLSRTMVRLPAPDIAIRVYAGMHVLAASNIDLRD